MDCIFCKIVSGEIPSKKIYEDDKIVAFLDINPANPGHTLVMPKKHIKNIYDISEHELKEIMPVVKRIAVILKERLGADGVNVIQNNEKHAGQLVDHIHFHIIPRFHGDKVIITYQRANIAEKDFDEIQKKLTEEKKNDYKVEWGV